VLGACIFVTVNSFEVDIFNNKFIFSQHLVRIINLFLFFCFGFLFYTSCCNFWSLLSFIYPHSFLSIDQENIYILDFNDHSIKITPANNRPTFRSKGCRPDAGVFWTCPAAERRASLCYKERERDGESYRLNCDDQAAFLHRERYARHLSKKERQIVHEDRQ